MTSGSRFVLYPTAVQELKRSPEVYAYLRRQAAEAERIAKSTAPTGNPHQGGGPPFAQTIYSDGDESEGRVVLGSEDMAAIWIETGTTKNPAYSTLRNAVTSAGLRLDATPPR